MEFICGEGQTKASTSIKLFPLMSTSNQNPTKQHSMACLLQKRMSNLVRGPNRSPSSVPHHNQVSDWTSVRLDSAMLCWMLPVLSVTLEKKQKCLCGCQNEGFKPSAKTQNPLQLKAACRACQWPVAF